MIISEKQIMQLIQLVHNFRGVLLDLRSISQYKEYADRELDLTFKIINQISNQQSEKLKVIE